MLRAVVQAWGSLANYRESKSSGKQMCKWRREWEPSTVVKINLSTEYARFLLFIFVNKNLFFIFPK